MTETVVKQHQSPTIVTQYTNICFCSSSTVGISQITSINFVHYMTPQRFNRPVYLAVNIAIRSTFTVTVTVRRATWLRQLKIIIMTSVRQMSLHCWLLYFNRTQKYGLSQNKKTINVKNTYSYPVTTGCFSFSLPQYLVK